MGGFPGKPEYELRGFLRNSLGESARGFGPAHSPGLSVLKCYFPPYHPALLPTGHGLEQQSGERQTDSVKAREGRAWRGARSEPGRLGYPPPQCQLTALPQTLGACPLRGGGGGPKRYVHVPILGNCEFPLCGKDCDYIKDLERRSLSWITWVGPRRSPMYPYEGPALDPGKGSLERDSEKGRLTAEERACDHSGSSWSGVRVGPGAPGAPRAAEARNRRSLGPAGGGLPCPRLGFGLLPSRMVRECSVVVSHPAPAD